MEGQQNALKPTKAKSVMPLSSPAWDPPFAHTSSEDSGSSSSQTTNTTNTSTSAPENSTITVSISEPQQLEQPQQSEQPQQPEQPQQSEQPEQQAPLYGPRTLRSYIRDSFRNLDTIEEQQQAHIQAHLTTSAPTSTRAHTPAPDPNNPRSDTESTNNSSNTRPFLARGNARERQNLITIRRQYYTAFVHLRDLINQLSQSQVAARKRYLRHVLVRLDRVLDRMKLELTQSTAATAAASSDAGAGDVVYVGRRSEQHLIGGDRALHRVVLRMHQDVMIQFTRLFREVAAKY
ncbi:hypothetical protein KI688_003027 [Linnemannia hyalina]|uniref:Uncharacterized protein n=1 Tax=Linnemannia hyalina TaxID=64524 RepID=A0A9P7XR84_9FUNG|nr:hypothetical protein KI688_003027 [Linnemannia hyalina]